MIHAPRRVLWVLSLLLIIFSVILAACDGNAASASNIDDLAMAPMSGMPAEVKSAPTTVQEAYQFSVANPELMKQIPCYCGCGNMGHTSNYACYVQNVDDKGVITYDSHALGCSICVDITQDAMRYLSQGKTSAEIRQYIDQTYAQYGPSNIP